LSLAAVLVFCVGAAEPQVVPYIVDVVGEEGVEGRGEPGNGRLRLIGTFKVFNPDTVPFYLWATFEHGGKFTHSRYGDGYPAVRMVELELRYKNVFGQPVSKKFSYRSGPRMKKRFSGSLFTGGGRAVKRGPRGRVSDEAVDVEIEPGSNRGGRGRGASEIVFWREDAQAYYEMELWGALYAPDVREAVVAGNYVENIKFEIESAR